MQIDSEEETSWFIGLDWMVSTSRLIHESMPRTAIPEGRRGKEPPL